MFNLSVFRRVIALCFTVLLVNNASAELDKLDKTTLKKAMAAKKVNISALSLGGYCGSCLKLQVTNNTQRNMAINVDPGLIFLPADSSMQNLVAWGDEQVEIAPGATKDVTLETFCGKSYAHCPRADVKYTFWKQGDSGMVSTLKFAKANGIAPTVVQSAVWMFTNGHSLNNVYNTYYRPESEKLVNYIAQLKHLPIPAFYTVYPLNNRPGESVIKKDSGKVVVPVKWGHEDYKQMYVTIYKANGDVYRRVDADRVIDKNGVTVLVEFKPKNDLNGIYKVQAKDNNNRIWYEKEVEIDFDERHF